MSHLTTTINVNAPKDMHLGDVQLLQDAPSVLLANFYGGNGALAPGWYLINRLYERLGLPFAGPFESLNVAHQAWINHRNHQRVTKQPGDGLLFAGFNSIIYDPTLILNAYAVSIGNRTRIDSFCKIEGGEGVIIGDRVHIASFAHIGIGGGVTILEEGSSVASHACIISGSNQPDAASCSPMTEPDQNRIVRKVTTIKKNATIFTSAVISPGVTIGEGARILPGAVVTQDVGPFETWGGVPAEFKRRDMTKWRATNYGKTMTTHGSTKL